MAAINFFEAAKLKWRDYRIAGSGSIAVLLPCVRRVELCDTQLEAVNVAADSCCIYCNKTLHRIVQPKITETPAPKFIPRPHWHRDLDEAR